MKKKLITLLAPFFLGALCLSTTYAMNSAPEGQEKKPTQSLVSAKSIKKWMKNNEDLWIPGGFLALRFLDGEPIPQEDLFDAIKPFVSERKFELVKEILQFAEQYVPITEEGATLFARQKLQRCAVFLKNISVALVVSEGLQSLPEKIGFTLAVVCVPLSLIAINHLNFDRIPTAMALEIQNMCDCWPGIKFEDLHQEAKAGMWRKKIKSTSPQKQENRPGNADDWTEEELLFVRLLSGNLKQEELKKYISTHLSGKKSILGKELLRVIEKRVPLTVEAQKKAKKDGITRFSQFVSDGLKGMIVWEGSKKMLELAGPGAAVVVMPVVVFGIYNLDDAQLIKWGQRLGVLIKSVAGGFMQWFNGNKAKAQAL